MSPLQIAVCCLAVVGVAVGKPTFLHYGVSPVEVSSVGVSPVGVSHVGVARVGVAPYGVAPLAVSSQYHSQDILGQYSYGYSGGHSAKVETKTADGVTRGGYSYVDPNGVIQSANYVADDAHGFSVAASNLPESPAAVEDTPEVAAAKAAHAAAYSEAAAAAAEAAPEVEASDDSAQDAVSEDAAPVVSSYSVSSAQQAPVEVKTVQYAAPGALAVSPLVHAAPGINYVHEAVPSKAFSYSTVAVAPAVAPVSYSVSEEVSPVVVSAPHVVSYNAVPSVAVANALPSVAVANSLQGVAVAHTVPVGVVGASSHQYHAQDALGHYTYGYVGGPSAKAEAKSLDGIVRGGYSYIDANGLVQSASYVADDVHGFRVAATNVPVAPEPVVAEA